MIQELLFTISVGIFEKTELFSQISFPSILPFSVKDQGGKLGRYLPTYALIAFDERVTFLLQLVGSLPCACAYVALFALRFAYNHYAIAYACNAANAHAQGSDWAVEAKKLTL